MVKVDGRAGLVALLLLLRRGRGARAARYGLRAGARRGRRGDVGAGRDDVVARVVPLVVRRDGACDGGGASRGRGRGRCVCVRLLLVAGRHELELVAVGRGQQLLRPLEGRVREQATAAHASKDEGHHDGRDAAA